MEILGWNDRMLEIGSIETVVMRKLKFQMKQLFEAHGPGAVIRSIIDFFWKNKNEAGINERSNPCRAQAKNYG